MSAATVESLENRLTGRLAGRLAGRVQATNVPRAAQVVSWMDLVDLCRELDDGLVAAETSSAEGLALHEAVLSLAIRCGGWLIHQIRTNGADISASGHTVDTIEAVLSNCCGFFIAAGIRISPLSISNGRDGASSMPRPEYIARLHGAF